MHACAAVRAHTRATCLPSCAVAFKRAHRRLVRRRMKMRVYVLRSCCPHAHPRLRAASVLLTCASPSREKFARSLRKAANITAPIKIWPRILASWRDAGSSRSDQREAAALAHMRSCWELSGICEWKQEDSLCPCIFLLNKSCNNNNCPLFWNAP